MRNLIQPPTLTADRRCQAVIVHFLFEFGQDGVLLEVIGLLSRDYTEVITVIFPASAPLSGSL